MNADELEDIELPVGMSREELVDELAIDSLLTTNGELTNEELLDAAKDELTNDVLEVDTCLTPKEKMDFIDVFRRYIQENPEMKDCSFHAIERRVFEKRAFQKN